MTYTIEKTEGYLGALGFKGNNYHKWRGSNELVKALREEFKANNIKGVTVKKERSGYLTAIGLTITATKDDLVDIEEYKKAYSEKALYNLHNHLWITLYDENLNRINEEFWEKFMTRDKEEQLLYLSREAEHYYKYRVNSEYNMQWHRNTQSEMFTAAFNDKMQKIETIVLSYNRDEGNSMVDYYDRAIYDHYYIKFKLDK